MLDDLEGLSGHYELIVLGTSLTESIVSCAAGKVGIKVLHLDRNDYYGHKYSANSLDSFIKTFSKKPELKSFLSSEKSDEKIFSLDSTTEDVFVADFQTVSNVKITPTPFRYDISKLHPSCIGYQMEKIDVVSTNINSISPVFQNYLANKDLTLSRALLKSRDFNLDTTSKVLLSSGSFIEALISSGVHRYLEFKSIEGVYYFINEHTETKNALKNELWQVPCSRTDVFNTTKLSVLEKRVLMKFYSFALDYGKEHFSHIEVTSLNEIELASGRSLYRPQTKQPTAPTESTGSTGGYNVAKFINLPFEDFLTDSKISKRLQNIIMYALSLRTTSVISQSSSTTPVYTTSSGIFDLYQHINSLGRFGETAFLCPLYGTGEMAQAFCRMSAVWGGVFVLRRYVDAVRLENVETTTALVDGVTSTSAEVATPSSSSSTRLTHVTDSTGRSFSCDAFVCNIQQWPDLSSRCTQFSVTRVSVCLGYLLPLSRAVVIIPPQASYTANGSVIEVGNAYAVHVIQSADNSTHAGINGTSILHITTTIDVTDTSGSLSWRDQAASQQSQAITLMTSIASLLQHTHCAPSTSPEDITCEGTDRHREMCHTTTMTPMYANLNGVNDLSSSSSSDLTSPMVPANVGLCFDRGESFHLAGPVEQAKQIFAKLFPGKVFLPSEEDLAAAAAESQAASSTTDGETQSGGEGEVAAASFSVPYSTGELSEADQETRYLESTLRALNVGNDVKEVEEVTAPVSVSETI